MRKIYKSLLIALSIFIITNANAQNYHLGDSMAIQTIRATNFSGTTALNWADTDPSTWIGVVWNSASPKRITELHLANDDNSGAGGSNGGNTHNGQNSPSGVSNGIPYAVSSINHTVTGTAINLQGNVDFSGLSELTRLILNGNNAVTNVIVSGLTKLQYLYLGNTGIFALDASGLTGLLQLKIPMSNLSNGASSLASINVSGCTNLSRIKASWNTSNLSSINLTGCTNLEQLNLKKSPALTSLDLTGITSLLKFTIGNQGGTGGMTSYPTNLMANTNLIALGLSGQKITAPLNLAPFTQLSKFAIGETPISSVNIIGDSLEQIGLKYSTTINSVDLDAALVPNLMKLKGAYSNLKTVDVSGISSTINAIGLRNGSITDIIGISSEPNIKYINVSKNKLALTNAVQVALVPIARFPNNAPDPVENESPYSDVYLIPTDSVDYSTHDSIDVNGTMVSTTFTLYKGATPIDTNTTGIFVFNSLADTGIYTVTMVNSGVSITTRNIIVYDGGCSGIYHAGDSAVIANIFANNFSAGTELNWDNSCPGFWNAVVWNNSNPKRIVALNLVDKSATNNTSKSGKGGHGNNGSNAKNVPGGIPYSSNYTSWPYSGLVVDLQGNLVLTGLDSLKTLVLQRNGKLTGLDLTGCNALEHLHLGNTNITNLDVSGLTNLINVKGKNMGTETVDASGCTSLEKFAARRARSLTTANFSGCSSLELLNLKRSSNLSSLDLTGTGSLLKLSVSVGHSKGTSGLSAMPTGWKLNTKLMALGVTGNYISDTLDLTGYDSLRKFSFRYNEIPAVLGVSGAGQMPYYNYGKGEFNRLSLKNAVEIGRNTVRGDVLTKFDGQINDGFSILYTDSIDFSIYDTITVAGTPTASLFELFDNVGASVTTNNSGIFTFTIADTGAYTVQMTNGGVMTVTTETINVLSTAGSKIAVSMASPIFGDVLIGNSKTEVLTVNNTGLIDLNVSNITVPTAYSVTPTTATIAANSSADFNITFTPLDTIFYPGTITVLNDATISGGINTVSVNGRGIGVVSGINQIDQSSISFYPNPTTSKLYIKNNDGSYDDLYIYSIHGMLLKRVSLKQATYIDMSELSQGVYFIQSEDRVVNQKIIKF